ncbi:CAF17-like 4Fe-4S cluster assembly/insertion protein YgfZ [Salinarimonas soli]|uniref:Folate-binding protein YgfZ n=1 Tax=Salinarimonas soli TaxID=1638099 RepID=A0A5B2VBE7_9HYPH|nr:folate-binding protein YgfZ [Salinarimonas soli]KAA2236086.1 folate-binding protein YgfZ [Salinarimonas soli]
MPTAHLTNRGVVRVAGADARTFLQGLVTCDIDRVAPGEARYGALLTPQGKIIADFIVIEAPEDAGGGFYLDAPVVLCADLAKRLGFYRLRAKVEVADLSSALAVVAGWGDAARPADEAGLVHEDPRLPALGWRAIMAGEEAAGLADATWEEYLPHRVRLGIPEGVADFTYGDAFPHEALLDQLGGVDFDKGCYVGQEVVSRMQHRGTARTRIVSLVYPEGFSAEVGSPVVAGERGLGTAGSGAGDRGLALIRVDRATDALAAGEAILSGGMPVRFERPDWARFPYPGEGA